MTNTEYYYELTKKSIDSKDEFLKIKPLIDMNDILPILKGDYGVVNYNRLNAIVFQRYCVGGNDNTIYDIKLSESNVSRDIKRLDIFGAKDEILDLSEFINLERLDIWGSVNVREIIFPEHSGIKMLNILRVPKLEVLDNISSLKNLRYFSHRYSSKISNFNFLSNLEDLIFLSINNSKNLSDVKFLELSKIYYLDLSNTNVIKNHGLLEILEKMINLRFFYDGGNTKNMRAFLKKHLPNVSMLD